jgi:hypothetical protein
LDNVLDASFMVGWVAFLGNFAVLQISQL